MRPLLEEATTKLLMEPDSMILLGGIMFENEKNLYPFRS